VLATTDGPKVVEFAGGKELHDFDSPSLLRHLAMSGTASCWPQRRPLRIGLARITLWDLTTARSGRLRGASPLH